MNLRNRLRKMAGIPVDLHPREVRKKFPPEILRLAGEHGANHISRFRRRPSYASLEPLRRRGRIVFTAEAGGYWHVGVRCGAHVSKSTARSLGDFARDHPPEIIALMVRHAADTVASSPVPMRDEDYQEIKRHGEPVFTTQVDDIWYVGVRTTPMAAGPRG